MNLKCFATPETMQAYQQLYRSEHDRLQKLHAEVKKSRKEVAALVNTKECSVEVDVSVLKLWTEAGKAGAGFSIIQARKHIENIATEEAFEQHQKVFADLDQEETKVFKKMMAQLIEMKVGDDKQTTTKENDFERVKGPEKVLYDPEQEKNEELEGKLHKTNELLKKTAKFIDRSKEKENLEDEVGEIEAGQLISEGNNLKKILYECAGGNIGIIPLKDGSENNKKLVWRVKENSEQLEDLANDIAGIVVKLENAIQRKKTEEIQKQRNLPPSKLPIWSGDSLPYLAWRQELDCLIYTSAADDE